MNIVNKKGYEDWKSKQGDDAYSLKCFNYAERWAELMEQKLSGGAKLEEVAMQSSHDANTEGITGSMYGVAVEILSRHWKHGEQLRQWSNLSVQVENEGERANQNGTVLNPAIMRIAKR